MLWFIEKSGSEDIFDWFKDWLAIELIDIDLFDGGGFRFLNVGAFLETSSYIIRFCYLFSFINADIFVSYCSYFCSTSSF